MVEFMLAHNVLFADQDLFLSLVRALDADPGRKLLFAFSLADFAVAIARLVLPADARVLDS